jgi:camphor 5-monooxygenase
MVERVEPVARPSHVPEGRVVDFDIYRAPAIVSGYHNAMKRLHEKDVPEVFWTPQNGGHWVVTRGKLMEEVLTDWRRFTSRLTTVPKAETDRGTPAIPFNLDPPAHRSFRALYNENFSPKAVAALTGKIRAMSVQMIEDIRLQGRCNFTAAYAERLPMTLFMTMVDLPMADIPKLKRLADGMIRADTGLTFEEVYRQFAEYSRPLIDARRGKDGKDVLSHFVNGKVNGRDVTIPEALELYTAAMAAGLDTVVNFLGFMVHYLATHPAHRRELAADPTLIPAATDEFLRGLATVVIGREVAADTELAGAHLKKGDMVITLTALHAIDEQAHPTAMDIDFHRPSVANSTFGHGVHRCPGAHLARAEILITLQEWMARIPEFELDTDSPPVKFSGGLLGYMDHLPLIWDVKSTRAGAPH